MNNPSAAYWKLRASQRMASYHRSGDKTVNIVSNAYDKAASDIRLEMDKIFKTYATNGKVDPKIAKKILNEKISDKEWNLIKQQINTIKDPDIRRQMLMKLNAPAYRARLTRLQALHEDVYIKSKVLADVEIKQSKLGYVRTIYDAYYKTMYDTQHGLGIGFNFAQMPNYTIQEILMNPWSGQHFSARVWGNTDVLAANLNNILTSGFMSGASRKQMSDQLMAVTDSGKFAANRLIRTEYTYMANQAEHAAYKAADIEQYMFVATLDKKTSIPCRKTDRKVFKVKDGVPGKNMPPLHTWCRSTTIAYFGQETLEGIQRRARDPETGKTMLVPANMSYEQWQKEMDNKYDNGLDNGSKGLKVTDAVRDHAAKGEFTNPKNPKKQAVGRFKNGGHGQDNILLLEQFGIQYNIVKEYYNGVRIGNVPDHKEKIKQTGTKQSWFPVTWKAADIQKAGEYVANLKDKSRYTLEPKWIDDELIAIFKYANFKGVTVGMVYDVKQKKITTVFPDETQRLLGGG